VTHGGDQIWSKCADAIRDQVSEAVWHTTFRGAKVHAFDQRLLTLMVPTSLQKARIERRYFELISRTLNRTAPNLEFCIEIESNDSTNGSVSDHARDPATSNGSGVATRTPVNHESSAFALLPDHQPQHTTSASMKAPTKTSTNYRDDVSSTNSCRGEVSETTNGLRKNQLTFEQFVEGNSNTFALAAARAVAEDPARAYNPLFIYGPSGLGKTHLLRAIAHYVRVHFVDKRSRYVTSETFLNDFVEAIRNGTQHDFKRRYRTNDVLLVDDIQFIEGKESLQEEFFHTFNDLLHNGAQIVLSSDRAPDNMPTLENRLRNRFKSGLITDIQPPDLMTRLAILKKKAEYSQIQIPSDVLSFIAESITDSIRELEGALIKVKAYATIAKRPISISLTRQILADIINSSRAPITVNTILAATSELCGVAIEQITGPSRRRNIVDARQIAMYVTRDMTDLSYPDIGRAFGGRDHTTVIHAVRKIEGEISSNRDLFDKVQQLQQRISRT